MGTFHAKNEMVQPSQKTKPFESDWQVQVEIIMCKYRFGFFMSS
jgi:hypothetical protein